MKNENPLFRNKTTDHDVASTRIIFVYRNGLDLCTHPHRLIELLDNS